VTDTLDDTRARWGALSTRALACLEAGKSDEANLLEMEADELSVRLAMPSARFHAAMTRARRAMVSGRLPAASALIQETFRVGREAREQQASAIYAAQLYVLRWDEGRVAELAAAMRAATPTPPGEGAFIAHAHVQLGDLDRARDLLTQFASDGWHALPVDGYWTTTIALFADTAASLGEDDVMTELYDMLVPWRRQFVLTTGLWLGAIEHHLGRLASGLGRFEDADEHFRAGADAHARVSAPVWLARTRLCWGDLLLERGDDARAKQLLSLALRAARRLGCRAIEREAATLLAREAS
jgi:tetratricopeptide (TPR) repeat protein